MSGVCLSCVHQVTAIIFTVRTVGATDHLVRDLDEFLFLQIDPPRLDGRDNYDGSIFPYGGANHYVSRCLGVETTKFKMLNSEKFIKVLIPHGKPPASIPSKPSATNSADTPACAFFTLTFLFLESCLRVFVGCSGRDY